MLQLGPESELEFQVSMTSCWAACQKAVFTWWKEIRAPE
jgi:hypothetical protein